MADQKGPGFVAAARQSLAGSAAVGAAAFVVNYVLVYVFLAIDGVSTGGDIPTWKLAGWVLFNAQNVETTITRNGQSQTVNFLETASSGGDLTSTVPKLVYYIVPALVLLGAGYYAYKRINGGFGREGAAGVGASIVGGYVVLSIVCTYLFKYTGPSATFSSGPTWMPKTSSAVLIAGIVYPVVLGAIGGYVAAN